MAPELPHCDSCGDRRYHRTPAGWARCDSCWTRLLSLTYITPMIREVEVELPPDVLAQEPWPLADRRDSGSYVTFRRGVWRSLLHYYDRHVRYEYLDAWRLGEIHFQRDPDYTSVRALKDLDLVVIVAGLADPPNTYVTELIRATCHLRQMHGRPTWVYTAGARAESKPLPSTGPTVPLLPKDAHAWD